MPRTDGQYTNQRTVIQKLDTVGDGSGNTNFNADYSVTPITAFIQPPVGTILNVHSLEISVLDDGNFNSDQYGNITALTNGVLLRALINDVIITTGRAINNNAELFSVAQQKDLIAYTNAENGLYATLTFLKSVDLNGDKGDQLQIFLNDNFTGITTHEFVIVASS